ncbi:hypothetical protein [Rufibacter radiotolerans]|nr:hypothetical protein [Rufibacter radiotolerans]
MQTLRKSMHLSLIVAFLWASFGFRVDLSHCAGEKDASFSLLASSDCCCGKAAKTPKKPCKDMTCALPQAVFTQASHQYAPAQQLAQKAVKQPLVLATFPEHIWPALLEKLPHSSLPPPVSGRTLGILYQNFLI